MPIGIEKPFKVILIGDPAVGKTTLRRSFMGETFKADYTSTLGVDFASKMVEGDDYNHIVQIWDMAGQVSFENVLKIFYKNSNGMILVFDLTNLESFDNLINWITKFLELNENQIVPIVLLGNKSDLVDENNILINIENVDERISQLTAEINKVSLNVGVKYFETSAKLSIAVDQAFLALTNMMHNLKIHQ